MKIVKQLDIVVPDHPNSIARISDALRASDVNMEAISCTRGKPNGTVHVITNDPELAVPALEGVGNVSVKDVLAVEMKNEPGGIGNLARALGSADININNVYASTSQSTSLKVLMAYVEVDDVAMAKEALEAWKESGKKL